MAALRKALTIAAACSLCGSLIEPALAREVDRQEVAEEFADDVEQEQRLYCRDTRLFTMTDGTELRACIDWRAQNRTRLVRTYAVLEGPDQDSDENLAAARDCFDIAVASQNDPARLAFNEEIFLPAASAQFVSCALARNLQRTETYSLRVQRTGVWVGGR